MKLIGKILLWVFVVVLLALLCWVAALYMAWPLWVGVALFFACFGLYFLVKFLRRLFIVMRSRSRLAQQAGASRQSNRQGSPEALLTRKWKAAIATLRGSSLKRLGNPLYVLPWYMVIGKSGTGKTTALTRARLSSPIQKISQSARIEQTENYDWWYFDKAVVIDSAGRYVDAQDIDQDRREWELGLDLLARYRPKDGLDGLVLAIGAERLDGLDNDALIEEGSVIRARIEQLIQMFGKRFPIYVLVTKCDRLYGLEEWVRALPDQALEQAMGYLSEEIEGGRSEAQFLASAFESIGSRLRKLRIALVARSNAVAPELLLFPNELDVLRPKLELFLHACLADNPYLERPFLRGLFFSSGQQEGGAVSSLLGNVLPPVSPHPNAGAGLFLHDFFGRILPADRYSARPAMLVNRWRQVTQNFGLVAWLLISVAIGILITLSFVSNMETLNLVREQRPFDAALTGKLEPDVAVLARTSKSLEEIERRNHGWKTEWMVASTNLDDLEDRLKQKFVADYRKYVAPINAANYREDFTRTQAADPNHELPGLIRNLVRGINLAQARVGGAGHDALADMPQRQSILRYSPQFTQQLNRVQVSSLAWTPAGDPLLTDYVHTEQALLDQVAYADPNMAWLAGLTPDDSVNGAVTAADFWGGAPATDGRAATIVPAAFTRTGHEAIESFLAEMQKSVDDGSKFLRYRAAFEVWYRDQRILVWQKFVNDFADAERGLVGEADWRNMLVTITSTQSPYYRLIARLNDEFRDYAAQDLPSWLLLARDFGQLHAQVTRSGATNKAVKVVGAINSVGGKAVREVLDGAPVVGERTIRNNLSAVDLLGKYYAEVSTLATDVVRGQGQAYLRAVEFHQFGIDPAVKASSAHAAAAALTQLKQAMNHQSAADDAVWKLIGGPLHFTLSYTEQQASCELQKDWQAKVHWPLQTATDKSSMINQLYGDKGTVWAFIDGVAAPFLARDAKRFRIIETMGYSVPFTAGFLPTINGAVDKRVTQLVAQQQLDASKEVGKLRAEQAQTEAKQVQAQMDATLADVAQKIEGLKAQAVQLSIIAQPTGVNVAATAKPFETVLTIQCAAGSQQLNNFNFPVGLSFPWALGQCGEVSLQIKIGTLVLTKKYPGSMGMINFLRDFRSGLRQFHADEFPSAKAGLDALSVRQIAVRYAFEGQDVVLRIAQQLDAYDKQQKESLLEKQKSEETLLRLSQEDIQQKLAAQSAPAGSARSAADVSLPEQIGVCWNEKAASEKGGNVQAVVNGLARNADTAKKAGAKPAPAAGSKGASGSRSVSTAKPSRH